MNIYLDHNATTPIHPKVFQTMIKVMKEEWGNPSSVHFFGRKAREIRESARQNIAHSIGVLSNEIIFTSGGTEANCLLLKGLAKKTSLQKKHIISTKIEHPSILKPLKTLEKEGFRITLVDPKKDGRIDAETIQKALRKDTFLVSVMVANNETGTIQPIMEIGALLEDHSAVFHCDAVQAFGKIEIQAKKWKVDSLTLSAHKINGPKGVGALFLKKNTHLAPLIEGGDQENKFRGGTENIPAIAGFGKASQLLLESNYLWEHSKNLQKKFQELLETKKIRHQINTHPIYCLPNTLNITFPRIQGERLLFFLDLENIAVSMGSACSSGSLSPSHVLLAMGRSPKDALATLRFSWGMGNTVEDIEKTVFVIEKFLKNYR